MLPLLPQLLPIQHQGLLKLLQTLFSLSHMEARRALLQAIAEALLMMPGLGQSSLHTESQTLLAFIQSLLLLLQATFRMLVVQRALQQCKTVGESGQLPLVSPL